MTVLQVPIDAPPAPAPVRARLAAFGVDYLIISLYIALLVVLGVFLGPGIGLDSLVAGPVRGQLLGLALLTLPVVLYFALWESSAGQATPGKRVLGLRVTGMAGRRLPLGRSLLRAVVKLAPWELAHTCLWRIPGWPDAVEAIPPGVVAGLVLVWLLVAFYLIMPWMSRLHQAPHDRAAGSLVIGAAPTSAP